MKVTKTLRPGADGTKRYQRIYGARLVCVRYRRDPATGRRLTTVELVAAETHPAHDTSIPPLDARIHPNRLVHVRVEFHERTLRNRVKAAGGTWMAPRRAWELRYADALDLGLRDRVIDDTDMDLDE